MFHSVASSSPHQHQDGAGKDKAHQELNLARDMKGNRKGFCKCITKENEGLLNEEVDLVTEDTEKAKVLSDLFVLVSTGKTNLQEFLVPESSEKV